MSHHYRVSTHWKPAKPISPFKPPKQESALGSPWTTPVNLKFETATLVFGVCTCKVQVDSVGPWRLLPRGVLCSNSPYSKRPVVTNAICGQIWSSTCSRQDSVFVLFVLVGEKFCICSGSSQSSVGREGLTVNK